MTPLRVSTFPISRICTPTILGDAALLPPLTTVWMSFTPAGDIKPNPLKWKARWDTLVARFSAKPPRSGPRDHGTVRGKAQGRKFSNMFRTAPPLPSGGPLSDSAKPATAPLVTILLLTYQHEKFIAEATRGVLSQTYEPLEIIILDDASPDATPEIIAAELAKSPNRTDVRLIRNDRNLGFRGNTVLGLIGAHGEFIVRLGGDDIAAPDLIKRMVEVWQAKDVSLVTVNAAYIDAASKPLNRFHRDPTGLHDTSFETLARDGVNAVCFGAAIGFERALCLAYSWPPEYLQASDIMMPFYAYLAKGASFISEPLIQYRFHSSNLSASLAAERSASPVDKLLAEEHIFYLHLAHAFFMDEELLRLSCRHHGRYSAIAKTIRPLLAIQKSEMARKLVDARIKLHELGVTRLTAPSLPGRRG